MVKLNQKSLEVDYQPLEQYDYDEESEVMYKKSKIYAKYIGEFLIKFSQLEHALEIELASIINERTHDEGYIVIKDLEMMEKVDLFYNLAFPRAKYHPKYSAKLLNNLEILKKSLIYSVELRNKIAHAKWSTLDEKGFVRVDAKTDKINGLIKFKKVKITVAIMRSEISNMQKICGFLLSFNEKLNSA